MSGSNHQEERDARLLHLCPVCLRKLCWNLRVEPVPYLTISPNTKPSSRLAREKASKPEGPSIAWPGWCGAWFGFGG